MSQSVEQYQNCLKAFKPVKPEAVKRLIVATGPNDMPNLLYALWLEEVPIPSEKAVMEYVGKQDGVF